MMELFNKAKAVKLRSHHGSYLVADDDQQRVRQSQNGSSCNARWLVQFAAHGDTQCLRLKSCHGGYLTASNDPFLLGVTGNKVLQTNPDNERDVMTDWQAIKEGFRVKLRSYGGTFLRANGTTPPWRNSVTHDRPYVSSTNKWILWGVEAVDAPENEAALTCYFSTVSSFSLDLDGVGSEYGSPVSTFSPTLSFNKSGMDLFLNAKAVRLQSRHDKYLHADEDEETVTQVRNGSSKNARWTVEVVDGADDEAIIRLKSCYGKYLTASNQPFLLGVRGRKVLQTLPAGRLDSSVEWQPLREGNRVKLRTRYGYFLRANGSAPPGRNSVTHDIPHRSSTQDWILWDVQVVEIADQCVQSVPHADSLASEPSSPSTHSMKSSSFGSQEFCDSEGSLRPQAVDGRMICYHILDDQGNIDEGMEGICITFKGNGVSDLTQRLEEEIGLKDIIVCSRSPLNGKLYPLRLQLPPNSSTMHVFVIESSSKVAKDFAKTGIDL